MGKRKVLVFISSPVFNDSTRFDSESIAANLEDLRQEALSRLNEDVPPEKQVEADFLYTQRKDEEVHRPSSLIDLAESLRLLATADYACFSNGLWEFDPGCRIEHDAAEEYGVDILVE